MFDTLEPKPKHANYPYCNSTEICISLYKGSRHYNNCGLTYNELDEIRSEL